MASDSDTSKQERSKLDSQLSKAHSKLNHLKNRLKELNQDHFLTTDNRSRARLDKEIEKIVARVPAAQKALDSAKSKLEAFDAK